MLNSHEIISHIKLELDGFYSASELGIIARQLVAKVTGLSHTDILTNKSINLTDKQIQLLEDFLERLKKFEPIQYIVGETEFFGMRFFVNNNVLIPRPETEELIEWILNNYNKNQKIKILDIGTGSGCIAIVLKKFLPNSQVFALDISEDALKTAKQNAEQNGVKIEFLHKDILSDFIEETEWDIIVSNPPYIPENEKNNISSNVLDYEPHLALFVPENSPLLFYKKIIDFTKKHLSAFGEIYFETHYDKARDIEDLLLRNSFVDVEIRKDLSGNERMIRAKQLKIKN
jgi:protein-(glutamine-N5) methyltransferase, release factor-specific